MSGNHDGAFLLAVAAGCKPFWHDGVFGPAWHCSCKDERHWIDQQCSMVNTYRATELIFDN